MSRLSVNRVTNKRRVTLDILCLGKFVYILNADGNAQTLYIHIHFVRTDTPDRNDKLITEILNQSDVTNKYAYQSYGCVCYDNTPFLPGFPKQGRCVCIDTALMLNVRNVRNRFPWDSKLSETLQHFCKLLVIVTLEGNPSLRSTSHYTQACVHTGATTNFIED